jgi:GNAT superfamily N-acetyltransferase
MDTVSAGGSDQVVVRRATPEDVPGWLESSAALFAEDAGTRDPTMNTGYPHELGVQGYAENLAKPDRLAVVALVDGQVVGHLTGSLAEPQQVRPIRVATLSSLYVRPAYRSHGLGARFVAEFRRWAKEHDADRIAVTAFAANDSAVRFYQREGFVPMTLTLETTP